MHLRAPALAHALKAVVRSSATTSPDRRRPGERSRAPRATEGAADRAVRHLSAAPGDDGEPTRDPVARFHLHNGARLERIDWLANASRRGLRESLGLMVNFLYEPKSIESNHESFARGEIAASRRVRSLVLGG